MVSTDGPSVSEAEQPEPNAEETQAAEDQAQQVEEQPQPQPPVKESRKLRRIRRQRKKIHRAVMEFQPDAVEIEQRPIPGGARWTLYVVLLLIVSTVSWATWAQVDRLVVAPGKLITSETPIVIQAASPLPIREIKVQFGDVVEPGQVLAVLETTFSQAELTKLESNSDSLAARMARLEAEQKGEEFLLGENAGKAPWQMELNLFEKRRQEYEAKISEFDSNRAKYEQQIHSLQTDMSHTKDQLDIYEEMQREFEILKARNAASKMEMMQRELQHSQAKRTYDASVNRQKELDEEIGAVQSQRSAYIANRNAMVAEELVKARKEYTDIDEELKKARRSNELSVLTVPTDLEHQQYVVLEVTGLTRGSTAQPEQPLFKLVPLNSTFEAEVEIPGQDVARIRVGDTARVKLTSFPYQKHGTLEGRVKTVSEGSFQKGEGPMQQTVFRARIEFVSTKLDNVPEDFRLLPGMTAVSEIKIGRRRVIEYFIYPVLRHLDSSIREP